MPLTAAGRQDAESAGHLLHDIPVDRAFTSLLQRAQETLAIILRVTHHEEVPIVNDAALNERDYGDRKEIRTPPTPPAPVPQPDEPHEAHAPGTHRGLHIQRQ
ncbi:MAG: histidine phosphatase family protein [Thermomicrobiales bacterium]